MYLCNKYSKCEVRAAVGSFICNYAPLPLSFAEALKFHSNEKIFDPILNTTEQHF